MKFIAIILFATLALSHAALSDEEKSKAQTFAAQCIESSKVSKELIVKARALEYTGRDPHLANYYSCLLTKLHFQKPDGSFDIDFMISKVPGDSDHETSTKAVKKCAVYDAAHSNDDNAMNMVYCFYKIVGKDYKFLN